MLVSLLIVAIMLVWSVTVMIYSPMRRPASMIRNHVLRHTPIGTYIDDAIEIIESNERWGTPIVNRNTGFMAPGIGVPDRPFHSVIGDQSVQTRPERQNVILFHERSLRIFWGFDENGKLVEVLVSSSFSFRI